MCCTMVSTHCDCPATKHLIYTTRRCNPLHKLSSSSCGGLWPLAEGLFMLFLLIFGSVVTSVNFWGNHRNFEKNSKNLFKNPKKSFKSPKKSLKNLKIPKSFFFYLRNPKSPIKFPSESKKFKKKRWKFQKKNQKI